MGESLAISDMIECKVIIVNRGSKAVLAVESADGFSLPCVSIAVGTRPAQELCKSIHANWGLRVLILDFVTENDSGACIAFAELLATEIPNHEFALLQVEYLFSRQLLKRETTAVLEMLNGATQTALSQPGWIDEAVLWVEGATGRKLSSKHDIEQWNAGGGFALARFRMDDRSSFWLKATGESNAHECAITCCLSQLSHDSLPRLVAVNDKWNAWLMEEAGTTLADRPAEHELTRAARAFASLQLRTANCLDLLLAAGAFDLRLSILRSRIDPITKFLIDAMVRQKSTKVAPIGRKRLQKLAAILHETCDSMDALGIPDTLIHNDLSEGNILDDGNRCVFTDWSEAAIGPPFLTCERLCQLNPNYSRQARKHFMA